MDTITLYLFIFCDLIVNFWKPPRRNVVICHVDKSSESWKREAVVFASYKESDVVFMAELRIWNASTWKVKKVSPGDLPTKYAVYISILRRQPGDRA